jgi:hypothetical protein
MEFIEGEKNFNKILCRLSAIMHQDDPRYLDLTFDRTIEQRQKYKEDIEAAKAAATTLTTASIVETNNVVDALDPKELDEEIKANIKKRASVTTTTITKKNDDADDEDQQEEEGEENENDDQLQQLQQDHDHDMDADVEAREVVKRVKELLLVSLYIFKFIICV